MGRFLKLLFLSVGLAALVTAGLFWAVMREPKMGGDFSLGAWKFSAAAKPLNLLYIGYAKCPDVCPMTLGYASQAFHKLSAEEEARVRLIFLSVDSAHDTMESAGVYARQFHPGFLGVTGTKPEIDQAVQLFGASYVVEQVPGSYLGYSIAHTDKLFFLDDEGRVLDTIPIPRSAENILSKIKELL